MALAIDDGNGVYHEINVNVSSLRAWSDELHRLVGLTQAANNSTKHWSVKSFAGSGPPGALQLRDANANALQTLAGAVEMLDELIARLRDAAWYVASSYSESDAYAKATADSVTAGMSGELPYE